MNKETIIFMLFLTLGAVKLNAQTKKLDARTEANEVAKKINNSIDEIAKSVNEMDFTQLNELIYQTVDILEKNSDDIVTIIKKVDTEKLQKSVEVLTEKISKSIDVEKLEERLDEVSQKLQKAITEKEKNKNGTKIN